MIHMIIYDNMSRLHHLNMVDLTISKQHIPNKYNVGNNLCAITHTLTCNRIHGMAQPLDMIGHKPSGPTQFTLDVGLNR